MSDDKRDGVVFTSNNPDLDTLTVSTAVLTNDRVFFILDSSKNPRLLTSLRREDVAELNEWLTEWLNTHPKE